MPRLFHGLLHVAGVADALQIVGAISPAARLIQHMVDGNSGRGSTGTQAGLAQPKVPYQDGSTALAPRVPIPTRVCGPSVFPRCALFLCHTEEMGRLRGSRLPHTRYRLDPLLDHRATSSRSSRLAQARRTHHTMVREMRTPRPRVRPRMERRESVDIIGSNGGCCPYQLGPVSPLSKRFIPASQGWVGAWETASFPAPFRGERRERVRH